MTKIASFKFKTDNKVFYSKVVNEKSDMGTSSNRNSMNWITERWLPIEIQFKGEVKFGKLPKRYAKNQNDQNAQNNQNAQNDNLITINSETSKSDFIKLGKIKLVFAKITVQAPVFIFLEFDD